MKYICSQDISREFRILKTAEPSHKIQLQRDLGGLGYYCTVGYVNKDVLDRMILNNYLSEEPVGDMYYGFTRVKELYSLKHVIDVNDDPCQVCEDYGFDYRCHKDWLDESW